ncbi:hypothetical protein [Sorangium sp. So ce406]|uniref:hypothetical protein n=1 Tax=Sorangium sp. So ce406 TaxID=3133311 RepID=UPI003F5B11A6
MSHRAPLPPELAFVRGGLQIAYRASLAPQKLALLLDLEGPDPGTLIPFLVRTIIEEINAGAAGGAEFDPGAGRARWLEGPIDPADPAAVGPSYLYGIEVAAVSPRYLRHVVELLGGSGRVRSLSLFGGLPLDGSALSVREGDVEAWMHPPRTHLELHPAPFTVRDVPLAGKQAFVRAVLADTASNDLLLAFDDVLLVWTGCLVTYGGAGGLGRSRVVMPPGAGRGGHILAARWDEFLCERRAARNLLINLVGAFHLRAARVARLDVGLP